MAELALETFTINIIYVIINYISHVNYLIIAYLILNILQKFGILLNNLDEALRVWPCFGRVGPFGSTVRTGPEGQDGFPRGPTGGYHTSVIIY